MTRPAAAPVVRRREAVLVTGPRLAGVTAVAAALRDRLPGRTVVEELAETDPPAVVVFVVSAAAALTASDWAPLDAAAARTDAVIGAVSKIDVHRHWPQRLQDAIGGSAAHAPRYRAAPWVAVAAAPKRGAPRLDDLVAELRKLLGDDDLERRNRLREWECQLQAAARQHDRDAADRRARMGALQQQRDTALRRRRLLRSDRSIALRREMSRARLQLAHSARNRCSALRAELHQQAAAMTRGRLAEFEAHARGRADEVVVEVDRAATERLTDVAHTLDLDPADTTAAAPPELAVPRPALTARRLETQLMMTLGAGFGLGVALTLSRLFAHLGAGVTAAGAAACAAVGLAVTVWVVRTRGVLHDRAVLDRWVSELTAALRGAVADLVALRALTAESTLSAALAERNEADGARLSHRIAALDGQLRELAAAATRAAAAREREMPVLRRALDAVRIELRNSG